MTMQELLPEQLQTPPRVVTDRTPVVARAAPLSLAPSGLAADEEEALARVSDPAPTDIEVRRGRPCREISSRRPPTAYILSRVGPLSQPSGPIRFPQSADIPCSVLVCRRDAVHPGYLMRL